jgi:two-component system, NarL family, response regulator NreC
MTHLHLAPPRTEPGEPPAQLPIRVVLADDHAGMRSSLRGLLAGEEGVDVVAEADDLAAAMRQVHGKQPRVLVLDLRMPGGSSVEAIRTLQEREPHTKVVVLTMDDNPNLAQHATAAGALGYVLKEHADSELPQAVRCVACGKEYVSPRVAARLNALRSSTADGELTVREVEILRLIALGHTSVEIAAKLALSPRTVESHRARIHAKLGLATRAELARYVLGRGLLRH